VPYWDKPELAAPCREALVRAGGDGYLLYRDGAPVGWCQAAPRDSLPRLGPSLGLPADPEAWIVACLVLVPEERGRGLAHELLGRVVDALRARGARRVQAVACRYAAAEDTSAFIEFPETLCRRAGMTLVQDHRMRPLYELPQPGDGPAGI
jgi:GNAT superfamily N-acetyltransferase